MGLPVIRSWLDEVDRADGVAMPDGARLKALEERLTEMETAVARDDEISESHVRAGETAAYGVLVEWLHSCCAIAVRGTPAGNFTRGKVNRMSPILGERLTQMVHTEGSLSVNAAALHQSGSDKVREVMLWTTTRKNREAAFESDKVRDVMLWASRQNREVALEMAKTAWVLGEIGEALASWYGKGTGHGGRRVAQNAIALAEVVASPLSWDSGTGPDRSLGELWAEMDVLDTLEAALDACEDELRPDQNWSVPVGPR